MWGRVPHHRFYYRAEGDSEDFAALEKSTDRPPRSSNALAFKSLTLTCICRRAKPNVCPHTQTPFPRATGNRVAWLLTLVLSSTRLNGRHSPTPGGKTDAGGARWVMIFPVLSGAPIIGYPPRASPTPLSSTQAELIGRTRFMMRYGISYLSKALASDQRLRRWPIRSSGRIS